MGLYPLNDLNNPYYDFYCAQYDLEIIEHPHNIVHTLVILECTHLYKPLVCPRIVQGLF